MLPPSYICEQLFKLNPSARLAWAGEIPKAGELNAGSFALVQLYPWRHVGPLDSPIIFDEIWHVTTRPDAYGKAMRTRIDRGPIFNRYGSTFPDWDPLFMVPVYKVRFKDYGVPNELVASGDFIPLVARWMRPLQKRIRDSQEAAGRNLKRQCQDIGQEAGKRLWREANRPDAASTIVPHKNCAKETDEFLKANTGIENYYDTSKVFR